MKKINIKKIENLNQLCICIKDHDALVQYQNQSCEIICGNQLGETCNKNCMPLYQKSQVPFNLKEGTHHFPDQKINDKFFDIIMINDQESLTTLLYPLENKHLNLLEKMKTYPLTSRELEIAEYMIQGYSNRDISEKLFISPGTLKTHINNIYKKLPPPINLRKIKTFS